MPGTSELLSDKFREWEERARGWRLYPAPVALEPPLVRFDDRALLRQRAVDDGRQPTIRSILTTKLWQAFSNDPKPKLVIAQEPAEPESEPFTRGDLVELQVSLPRDLDVSQEAFEPFLLNLSLCREPVAFELVSAGGRIFVQFAANPDDAELLSKQFQAHFPEAIIQRRENGLKETWEAADGEALAVEFGFDREFMFSLETNKLDPYVGIVGALSQFHPSEFGLFQVLWQKTEKPWADFTTDAVTGSDGRAFFANFPELTKAAEDKVSRPLFAVVVRVLVRAESFDRVLQLTRDLAASLTVFASPSGNELIPLQNKDYPLSDHVEDTLLRQSRRTGMILNSEELVGLVHLPTSAVCSPAFERLAGNTKAAPAIVLQEKGLFLGYNEHLGKSLPVRLATEQRVRHVHLIGASGTGKSNLLFNLVAQDVENGEGVAVLDPHGDLIDRVLGIIPPNRVEDVILVDPSDEEYSVGFNVLVAHSEVEKTLLASDLVSTFQRLSTSWGDQMTSVLQNAVLAFLENARPGTIADLRRFLIEPSFRAEFLKSVQDPEVVYYWQKGFPHLSGSKSIGPILTRLDTLLAKKPIRHMVSQNENRLDFGQIMDSGKIFLAKLPEGLLGRENSHLIGSLLISKFQQTVMARQAQRMETRRPFWIYCDEFANFITPSMAEILSGARRYRIGLTLAHHELHQLQRSPEVASAVMTHPYTRIVFRVGDDDAKRLAEGFSNFEAKDIRNLEIGSAICRAERSDYDFNLTVPLSPSADQSGAATRRNDAITASRRKYGTLRSAIEAELRAKLDTTLPQSKLVQQPAPAPPPTQVGVELASPVAIPVATPEIAPAPPASIPAPPVSEKGIGGHQHNLIRERIEQQARKLGFTALREDPTGSGGKIDVALKNQVRSIACEIAISTTIDHEVGNVAKCLAAGFQHVIVIAPTANRLEKLREAVGAALPKEAVVSVLFLNPDEALLQIERWASEDANKTAPAKAETFGKYKVKHSMVALTAEELKAREEAAYKLLLETMRKKKKK